MVGRKGEPLTREHKMKISVGVNEKTHGTGEGVTEMRKISRVRQLEAQIAGLRSSLNETVVKMDAANQRAAHAETRERQSQDMLIRAEKLAVERKQAEEDGIVIQQLTNIANSAVPDNALLSSAWHHSGGVTTNIIFVGQVRIVLKLIQRLQNGAANDG